MMTISTLPQVIVGSVTASLRCFKKQREQKQAEFALRFLSLRQLSDIGLKRSHMAMPG